MSEVKDLDVIGIRDPTAILILGKLDDFVELPGLQTGYVRISPFCNMSSVLTLFVLLLAFAAEVVLTLPSVCTSASSICPSPCPKPWHWGEEKKLVCYFSEALRNNTVESSS